MRADGYYWVRTADQPDWHIGQWWSDCWMFPGGLHMVSDDELEGLEVAGLAEKPLNLAWAEFMDTVAKALGIYRILDWIAARLR